MLNAFFGSNTFISNTRLIFDSKLKQSQVSKGTRKIDIIKPKIYTMQKRHKTSILNLGCLYH